MPQDAMPSREGYLHENFRFFHLRDTAGQERGYHFHEFDKLVFLISGAVTYLVEDTACAMRPADIVLVKHHTIHRADIDPAVPYDRIILYLGSGYMDRLAPGGGLTSCFDGADRLRRYLLRPDPGVSEGITALLTALEASLFDTDFGAEVMSSSLLMQLMVRLNRLALTGDDIRPAAAAGDPKIQGVLSYINENLASALTVDALALRAYMSRYHFMRLFKAQTGFTVHDYVRQKRLIRACQLIRGGMPVTKAAAECGFNDYSAFHRAFRDTFNISPAKLKPYGNST